MSYRDSVIKGVAEAKRYHKSHRSKELINDFGGRINVFKAILDEGTPLLFRPLKGLLGAYIQDDDKNKGILISTQRRLPIQRFTGAHELGHLLLKHSPSLDDLAVLEGKMPSPIQEEIQANAFAQEFLSPNWLLNYHARKQGWTLSDIKKPFVVYQLALRIGQSYEATCRTLQFQKLLTQTEISTLLATSPKSIKMSILPLEAHPKFWYGDVWVISEKDHGLTLEGHPDDQFVFNLREKSGAGYLWDTEQVRKEGFTILTESRKTNSKETIGGETLVSLNANNPTQVSGKLTLKHKRPWENQSPLNELALPFFLYGKENGLPRLLRTKTAA